MKCQDLLYIRMLSAAVLLGALSFKNYFGVHYISCNCFINPCPAEPRYTLS